MVKEIVSEKWQANCCWVRRQKYVAGGQCQGRMEAVMEDSGSFYTAVAVSSGFTAPAG